MDFDFNDDQEMLRDSVRKWVEKELRPSRPATRSSVEAGGYSKRRRGPAWPSSA